MSNTYAIIGPMPPAWTEYTLGFFIRGTRSFKDNVNLVFGKNKTEAELFLESEPDNPYDECAIQVLAKQRFKIWIFKWTANIQVGYLPSQLAETITNWRLLDKVEPRLRMVTEYDDGTLNVTIDIIGHSGDYVQELKVEIDEGEY